jgi:hypothetical protein
MSTLPLTLALRRIPFPRSHGLRLLALSYALKTLAFLVAWYFVPDLPQKLSVLGAVAWGWLLPD